MDLMSMEALTQKLQLAINNCARFVYNIRKYDHISQYSLISWEQAWNPSWIQEMCCLFTKLFTPRHHSICMITWNSQAPDENTCVVPIHKYLTSSKMFFINAIKLWNKLRHCIKAESNYCSFKSAISKLYTTL